MTTKKTPAIGSRVRIFDAWENVSGGGIVLDVDMNSVTVSQVLVSTLDGETERVEFPMRYSIINHTFEIMEPAA